MQNTKVNNEVIKVLNKLNIKSSSAIITIMGDCILPHNDFIWMSSLTQMANLFNIESRAIRTSIYRLTKDEWFKPFKQGRKSYYKLTNISKKRFETASKHIYSEPISSKTNWCRVLLLENKQIKKITFQKELQWMGFGTISGGTYIHPNPDIKALENIISHLKLKDSVVIMSGADIIFSTPSSLRKMGGKCWDLEKYEKLFNDFIKIFSPFNKLIKQNETITPEQAFVIRVLMLHTYRRIMVRYPILPQEILPKKWQGLSAYLLCCELYEKLLPLSEKYIRQNINQDYNKKQSNNILNQRFKK